MSRVCKCCRLLSSLMRWIFVVDVSPRRVGTCIRLVGHVRVYRAAHLVGRPGNSALVRIRRRDCARGSTQGSTHGPTRASFSVIPDAGFLSAAGDKCSHAIFYVLRGRLVTSLPRSTGPGISAPFAGACVRRGHECHVWQSLRAWSTSWATLHPPDGVLQVRGP